MTPPIEITWRARYAPLPPCVAIGHGEVARRLAARLVASDGHRSLRAVVSNDLLCVIGDGDALPWVDGIEYLGRDPRAPSLRLPTASEPSLPPELFERALLARAGASHLAAPLAVTRTPPRLYSLAPATLVSRAALQLWLERT